MRTLEKMDDFFAKRVNEYDKHMLNNIEGSLEFYSYTASLLPKDCESKVLDLGCGTGLELEEYFKLNSGAYVTAIDISVAMLNKLKEKFFNKNIEIIVGSYFDVPFEEIKYDAAVSVASLHHFTPEEKLSLYKKLFLALKPNGYFILTDYFANTENLEKELFDKLNQIKEQQNIKNGELYHYDTPLTVDHEIEILKKSGFKEVEGLKYWGNTCTIKAKK